MILVILEESNPSGQDQFKSIQSLCIDQCLQGLQVKQ